MISFLKKFLFLAMIMLLLVGIGVGLASLSVNDYVYKVSDSRWDLKSGCIRGCLSPENPDECECTSVYEVKASGLKLFSRLDLDSNNFWFSYRSNKAMSLINDSSKVSDWERVDFWINSTLEKIVFDWNQTNEEPCGYDKKITCYNYTLVNETIFYEGWIPFNFDKTNLQNDVKIGVTGLKKLNSEVDHVLNLNFNEQTTSLSNRDWWNTGWDIRYPVNITNVDSVDHVFQAVFLNLTGFTTVEGCDEIRVINITDNALLDYDILYNGTINDECWIHFTIDNLESDEIREIEIYTNSSSVVASGRTDYLLYYWNVTADHCSQPNWNNWSTTWENGNLEGSATTTCDTNRVKMTGDSGESSILQLWPGNGSSGDVSPNGLFYSFVGLYDVAGGAGVNEITWDMFSGKTSKNIGMGGKEQGASSANFTDVGPGRIQTLINLDQTIPYSIGLFIDVDDAQKWVFENDGSVVSTWNNVSHPAVADIASLHNLINRTTFQGISTAGGSFYLYDFVFTTGRPTFKYENSPTIAIGSATPGEITIDYANISSSLSGINSTFTNESISGTAIITSSKTGVNVTQFWYVDGVSKLNVSNNDLSTGSVVNSSLFNGNFSKGNIVKYEVNATMTNSLKSGLSNTSTIGNLRPDDVDSLTPSDGVYRINFNTWSWSSTDIDTDTITYHLWLNDSNIVNSTNTSVTVNGINHGNQTWNVSACDTTKCSPNSTGRLIYFDSVNPTVSSVNDNLINFTTIDVGITLNEVSNATVYYGLSDSTMNSSFTNVTFLIEQNITITGLSHNTIYKWRVYAHDNSSNEGTSTIQTTTTDEIEVTRVDQNVVTTSGFSLGIILNNKMDGTLFYGGDTDNMNSSVTEASLKETHNLTTSGLNEGSTYRYRFYGYDALNNEVTSTIGTITTSSEGGGGGGEGAGGGGSGEAIVFISELTNISVSSDVGTRGYSLIMSKGSSRVKNINIRNEGLTNETLKFKCEDLVGSEGFCDYVTIEQDMMLVSPSSEVFLNEFSIILPDDIPNGVYFFNIVASLDALFQDKLNVEVTVGPLGLFFDILDFLSSLLVFLSSPIFWTIFLGIIIIIVVLIITFTGTWKRMRRKIFK